MSANVFDESLPQRLGHCGNSLSRESFRESGADIGPHTHARTNERATCDARRDARQGTKVVTVRGWVDYGRALESTPFVLLSLSQLRLASGK